MRKLIIIVLVLGVVVSYGQKVENEVLQRMKRFHQVMTNDRLSVEQFIDDSLSYGHSNGWIENRNEFYNNLGGKITYHSIKEDSVRISVNKNVAHARFVADLDVSMDGKRYMFHLRVLEVWVKQKKNWKLFARQAIR